MLGVVIGNGPSKESYPGNGDFVIACNIPDKEIRVDATVICDEEIVWVLKNNLTLVNVPVIISTRVFEKMKELKIVGAFDILHIFKPKDWHNAAHYAADYLLQYGCEHIDLWGCDSVFDNDISSSTDTYVKKNMSTARFVSQWRKVWQEKFDKGNAFYRVFKNAK